MSKNSKSAYQSIKLFDINLFSSDKSSLLDLIKTQLVSGRSLMTVMTPNPEQVVLSRNNQMFLDHLQSADVCIPDGIGLVIASKIFDLSTKNGYLTQRITGREIAVSILDMAVKHDLTVVVIGGRNYGVELVTKQPVAVQQLKPLLNKKKYEKAFWLEGYADVSHPTKEEEAAITHSLQKIKPDLVFIAFGAPMQEKWLIDHSKDLEKNGCKVAMVVGGAFDVLLGSISPAPQLLQDLGLEWLYRLIQEPWRWRRQLKLLDFIKLTFQSI